ncbi:MAG: DNA-protecting protein DprA [Candidatus Nealsonbacteria bacterium]|nr:DNA-protecting protein DprA [Candidatus Nealsonbacteria bacterium]
MLAPGKHNPKIIIMNIVAIKDQRYPALLKKISKSAPKQLYYKGNWDKDIFKNCLAVVGSRQMTSYGKRAVEQIVTEVATAGITIVSGFMYGVDAMAHKAALNAGGRTIAVMPCGIDLIHPEYQQDLYTEILNSKGLIISEYDGTMQPANWTYPKRNRIVAGLSKACLVIEAGEKSGSLITANFAKKFKRKVFVVPGQIFSENSKGIMELLKQGATPVSSAKDILDYYGLGNLVSKKETKFPDGVIGILENQIITKLRNEALGADELARAFGVSAANLGVTLSMMQLRGLIRQDGSRYYID